MKLFQVVTKCYHHTFKNIKKDNKKGKAQSISTFLHTHLLCKLREKK